MSGAIPAELEHRLVLRSRHELDRATQPFGLVDVPYIGEGITRPVKALSVRSLAPTSQPGPCALPPHVRGHEVDERFDIPVIERPDRVLEFGDINGTHPSMIAP